MHESSPSPALTLGAIARLIDGRLQGDGDLPVRALVRPDQVASESDLVLLLDAQGLRGMQPSSACCALIADTLELPPKRAWRGWISVSQPRQVLPRLLSLFAPAPRQISGVHPSAVVEPSARIAPDAYVGPLCYVGEHAEVGSGVRLLSNCTLGADCRIGEGSLLYPGVRIGECVTVGRRAIIHANACIGADGFSFVPSEGSDGTASANPMGPHDWEPVRIPSLGSVVIEDDVEIGACTTIDRGTLGDTLIRRGAKLDNLVMVGHNSRIGECCLLAGQSGVAGSCELEDRVVIGGQSGVADHLRIGSHAVIAASSGVGQHVPAHALFIDTPAVPYERWQERWRGISRLKRMLTELERLKQRLSRLERRTENS